MNAKLIAAGFVVATIFVFAAWTSAERKKDQIQTRAPAQIASAPVRKLHGVDLAALAATPQVKAYRERVAFDQNTRDFFRDASKLPPAVREERSRDIMAEVDRREQSSEFSAAEIVMLRIAMIRATVDDQAERTRLAKAVVDHYQAIGDAKQAAYVEQQRRDSKLQAYRALEQKILEDVKNMRSFPNGMTRDEYVRMRDQEALQTAYGG